MKSIRNLIYMIVLVLPAFGTSAHDHHTDAVLRELNDYLMAIQLMRIDDPEAREIFKTWHDLRTESWEIRKLTDEQGLLINTEEVKQQIRKTREKQEQLLRECRNYFAKIIQKEPAVKFVVNQSIESIWDAPMIKIPVRHFRVLLIKIQNHRNSATQLTLEGNISDQILFWNKQLTLEPHTFRYTFVVFAPLEEKQTSNTLYLRDTLGNQASAQLQMEGTPMQEEPFTLQPGVSLTRVELPDNEEASPVDSHPPFSEAINFFVTEDLTGTPLPVRIEVKDGAGNNYWSPIKGPAYSVNRNFDWGWRTILWDYQPGPYFYINGTAQLGVDPAGKTATIYHGFEYRPVTRKIPRNGKVEVALERWINMPELGWYSGQTHIHTTDVGIPVQFSQYWPLISQAEDLHVSAILTLKGEWETHAIYANEYPMGKRNSFSTSDHIITYGEEFRNNPYGHLAFIGLQSLIQPISTGALGELGGPDYPPNSYVLDEALAQGATTIGAHFGNYIQKNEPIKTNWPSTGFEMPVDVALGKLQVAEIFGNGGQLEIWYDLLNCGFRMPATAGPDWVIKDTPRVYVNLGDEPFTVDNWRNGLQNGNSFITTGPMLFFKVNGRSPGSVLNIKGRPARLEIETEALLPDGNLPVEIVYNGDVIAKTSDSSAEVTVDDSGWIAVRCEGAHSNPVYIDFEGRPAGQAEPARTFIRIIDRLADWVKNKALFYNEDQKKEVLDVIDRGKAVYVEIIEQAEELGRQ